MQLQVHVLPWHSFPYMKSLFSRDSKITANDDQCVLQLVTHLYAVLQGAGRSSFLPLLVFATASTHLLHLQRKNAQAVLRTGAPDGQCLCNVFCRQLHPASDP